MPSEKPGYTVIEEGEIPAQVLCFALFGKSIEQVASDIRVGKINVGKQTEKEKQNSKEGG